MEGWGSVRIEELAGKGRSVVSCKALKGGEVALRDSPILLYSASPTPHHPYCDLCFRKLQQQHSSSCCSLHRFCTSHCHSSSNHSPWLCHSLSLLSNFSSPQLYVQARFLLSAYNLAISSPTKFRILMSLQSLPQHSNSHFLHSFLPVPPLHHFQFSPDLTASLLSIDKLNAFGLMEEPNLSGERSVRAYGIYPNASFFNHDCLPNAARFDYVDSPAPNNTDIIVRIIHDVPQGREICLSYFPVNLVYSARQHTLLNDYGFVCECDRCKVEASWSDHDEPEPENADLQQEEAEEMDEDEDEAIDNDENNEFPHAYFFMRYMCDRQNCWGTLAPLPTSPTQLECNVCAHIKNDPLSGLC